MRTDKMEVYNKCFQDFIDRGVLKEITEEELEAWEGGINYVSHHHVSKDSPSTPLRIVVNLSLKNNGEASYNLLIAKGPNTLSKLYTVLVRFRAYEVIIVWDLEKAYNSILTGDEEFFHRLVVWRFGDTNAKW